MPHCLDQVGPGADVWKYRVHCAPNPARVLPQLEHQSVPATGSSFRTLLEDAPTQGAALLVMGLSGASYLGTPLPYSLANLGAPGCAVLASPDSVTFVLTNTVGVGVYLSPYQTT